VKKDAIVETRANPNTPLSPKKTYGVQ